jgi:hypothetical protein
MKDPEDDTSERAIRLLIMRALLDGDVIDYPIAADHRKHGLFSALEAEGLIARWDRMWPLHDRYRLTERGTSLIQRLQDPDAQDFFERLKEQGLSPAARRKELRSRNLDPFDYSVVNDPYSSWETWDDDPGAFFLYVNEQDSEEPSDRPVISHAAVPRSAGVIDLDRDADLLSPIHDIPVTDIS